VLSFLVPAYNCDDTVAEAIESALAQQIDEDFEVVAVDDCSEDRTNEVLQGLAGRHDALRVLRHAENRGGGPARNTAAAAAEGELLYVLDADNVLPQGCVQPQLDELRRSGASAVSVGAVQFFDGETGEHRHRWEVAQDRGWSTLRHAFERFDIPAAHGNYLYTRESHEAVGGYEPDLGAMDAWSFGFKQLARGFDVAVARDVHYLHRIDRPDRASYWTRDQKEGRNDRNALTAVRREAERLPPDLRGKVERLRDEDPFFAIVAAGLFRSAVANAEFEQGIERLRRQRLSTAGRLRARAAQLLGRD
jgi:glycosyltransferase involved in cell wall biosynthesis